MIALYQPEDDEEHLYYVGVCYGDEAAEEGVEEGDNSGDNDGDLLLQAQDNLEIRGYRDIEI